MRIMILTQYFPPETGAAQNRLFELAVRMQSKGVDVTVVTAMPNYPQMQIYKGYAGKKYVYEQIGGLKVHRSPIFVSTNRSIISRLRNYFSFVLSSARMATKRLGDFDFILCESPPLFLGYTAMYLAKKKKARLIFNVSDLWPESAEKLGVITNRFLLDKAEALEEKVYRKSALVTGQTKGICNSISERFAGVKTYWLPNGVDLEYYDVDKIKAGSWRAMNGFSDTDFILLYAGILGIGQELEVILQAAKRVRGNKRIKFVLLGDGPERESLLSLQAKLECENVSFMDPVPKKEMPSILKSVNAAIIPLKKIDVYKGAIPSKTFECIAMKLPVLLGVDGEARDIFIEQGNCGLYFEPGNSEELAAAIEKLVGDPKMCEELGENGRRLARKSFDRNSIADAFLDRIQKI